MRQNCRTAHHFSTQFLLFQATRSPSLCTFDNRCIWSRFAARQHAGHLHTTTAHNLWRRQSACRTSRRVLQRAFRSRLPFASLSRHYFCYEAWWRNDRCKFCFDLQMCKTTFRLRNCHILRCASKRNARVLFETGHTNADDVHRRLSAFCRRGSTLFKLFVLSA